MDIQEFQSQENKDDFNIDLEFLFELLHDTHISNNKMIKTYALDYIETKNKELEKEYIRLKAMNSLIEDLEKIIKLRNF